jgi:MFS superfamily sulfate permease-like transporter
MQVNFLSRSVISGFTSAVAVVFIVAQVQLLRGAAHMFIDVHPDW